MYFHSVSGAACPTLTAKPPFLRVTQGGEQLLRLLPGAGHAGDLYLMLGTTAGTSPGVPVGSALLPLNPDGYTSFTLVAPNTPPLLNSFGVLDPLGQALATFQLPPSFLGGLVGLVVHHAYVVFDPSTFTVELASNPVDLGFVP